MRVDLFILPYHILIISRMFSIIALTALSQYCASSYDLPYTVVATIEKMRNIARKHEFSRDLARRAGFLPRIWPSGLDSRPVFGSQGSILASYLARRPADLVPQGGFSARRASESRLITCDAKTIIFNISIF